jgi:hypothetical protein
MGSRVKAPLILNIGTGFREWSVSFIMEKNAWYRLNRRLIGF